MIEVEFQLPDLIVPSSYSEARDSFVDLAQQCGAHLEHYVNEAVTGRDGEPLATDVAWIGPDHASACLLISSGVHGVEGFCGSAIQRALLEMKIDQHIGGSVIVGLIHAINPFGYSYESRVNEANVDVNRNFVDFDKPLPHDHEYERWSKKLYPKNWADSRLADVLDRLDRTAALTHWREIQQVMTRGQHQCPGDPYFAGTRRSWSANVWDQICHSIATRFDPVVHLDVHTGLGGFAECEIIYGSDPGSAGVATARRWLGHDRVRIPGERASVSTHVSGVLARHLDRYLPGQISLALEFGTVTVDRMLRALVMDNWLYHNAGCSRTTRVRVKKEMRAAFCPNDHRWWETIRRKTSALLTAIARGMTADESKTRRRVTHRPDPE